MAHLNRFHIVVAYTFGKQGIGKNGELPWHIPEDMAYFKNITSCDYFSSDGSREKRNVVIMGRKTWDSIPVKFKPLNNRMNIVITNGSTPDEYNTDEHRTNIIFITWNTFIDMDLSTYGKLFIIGGEQIYKMALESGYVEKLYATVIYPYKTNSIANTNDTDIDTCDTFFPKFEYQSIISVSPFIKSKSKSNLYIRHITYNIKWTYMSGDYHLWHNKEETAYLDLMHKILVSGMTVEDRTGVGTLSCFGEMLKYNLRDTFPISTTKRLFFRAVFEELKLYLSGKTDNQILQDKGITIWNGNTSREFLDNRGLTDYCDGDMGETYGFNMRHYGGIYRGCKTDYPISSNISGDTVKGENAKTDTTGNTNGTVASDISNYGYDQLQNVIHLIKNDPTSRRIIIDLWNPATVHKAALPSCLCKYQFNVNVEKKELNLAIYLRSSDYFLANNWNTCTGALLVHLLCNLDGINLTAGELTVFIADAHLYKTHIEQVKLNLARNPFPYPKLIVNRDDKLNKKTNILDFEFSDIELLGYQTHPNIKAEMAI